MEYVALGLLLLIAIGIVVHNSPKKEEPKVEPKVEPAKTPAKRGRKSNTKK